MKLKPILCNLFRELEALPAAVNKVLYRGVPSNCTDVVREKYLTYGTLCADVFGAFCAEGTRHQLKTYSPLICFEKKERA